MLASIYAHPLWVNLQKISVELAPKIATPIIKTVPFKIQQKVILSVLNQLFKDVIDDGDLAILENKWLKIDIVDLSLNWWLSFDGQQLIMANQADEDACFSANGDDLLLIAAREQDPDTLFFQRKLAITGDTELGLGIKNLIDSVDFDAMPHSAHQIICKLAAWIKAAKA